MAKTHFDPSMDLPEPPNSRHIRLARLQHSGLSTAHTVPRPLLHSRKQRSRTNLPDSIDVVYVLFCITTFVLTLTEILLYAKRNLQPLTYLIFQTVKTLFWFTYFIVVTIYNQAAETSLINSSEYQLQAVDGWTRYVLAAALTL